MGHHDHHHHDESQHSSTSTPPCSSGHQSTVLSFSCCQPFTARGQLFGLLWRQLPPRRPPFGPRTLVLKTSILSYKHGLMLLYPTTKMIAPTPVMMMLQLKKEIVLLSIHKSGWRAQELVTRTLQVSPPLIIPSVALLCSSQHHHRQIYSKRSSSNNLSVDQNRPFNRSCRQQIQ